MTKLGLFFWEPSISPHKLALCNALAHRPEVSSVTYVAQEALPRERVEQGWSIGRLNAETIVAPDASMVRDIVASSKDNAVHIFSGVHWTPIIVEGLKAVVRRRRRFGIMSEPRAFEGWKGWARYSHSWLTEAPIRRHADFVLAIGRNGPPWFRAVGYRQEKVFPFAYFLPPMAPRIDCVSNGLPPLCVFLGRLTREKGVPLFLESLRLVRNPIRVRIGGGGPEEDRVRAIAACDSLSIDFVGRLAMEGVPDFMRAADILVLPSTTRDDGWGAVISEALLAGAYVIASDRAGGSVCLDADWRGRVVSNLTPAGLAQALDSTIDSNVLTGALRRRRSEWAHARLTGDAGAEHLLRILSQLYRGDVRPRPFYADELRNYSADGEPH